ncbi:efflux RND transporter periplasmic adaptor subunit [Sulfurospirillum diekertiae]|uniref:Efflux RND transporter periplasmic adaptor subunit n=1 Tax=Sulfurospirillum diekertiae TaxID=1854492 RepID=A0A6G9VSD6_9BACT|nr:HlyD family efflux transporter periplasmic adaptor subunit [Sulfurospirillum diekertiae]QIR75882.1 efflux RND transporter periplasmic adaptor subunit [Sulfurospirillum diekertiae]QIR78522.1 efflux RND transporter periplasmic adaptor subunit [Sulfurospirillum diekertiae]
MKKIAIVITLALLGSGGWYYYQNYVKVLDKTLHFYGNIENRTQDLAFRFLGKIETIAKDEGQSIEKGEMLVTLDTTSLRYELENINAQIIAEKATLKRLMKGYRTEDIAQAQASVQESYAAFLGVQDIYNRQKKLFDLDATTEQDYIAAKTQYDKAKATYDKAKSNYALLQSGYQVEDVEVQKAKVLALEAKAKSLEYDIKDATIYAPIKGTILARHKEPSSIVSAGQSILQIALEDEYWVQAYVDEPDLGSITQGEKMLVYVDSRKKPYEGHIGFISPVAEFTPKNIETTQLRPDLVYRFRVIIAEPDSHLKQGMPVTITCQKDQ